MDEGPGWNRTKTAKAAFIQSDFIGKQQRGDSSNNAASKEPAKKL